MDTDEEDFLRQSNAIEGVYDERSFGDAAHAWFYMLAQTRCGLKEIRMVHKILMRNQDIVHRYVGQFRDVDVFVGDHTMVQPTQILPAIKYWIKEMNGNNPDWQKLHIEYERIHPFIDGNGRTGRIFMNWHRRICLGIPILVIHEGEEQRDYYTWFKS